MPSRICLASLTRPLSLVACSVILCSVTGRGFAEEPPRGDLQPASELIELLRAESLDNISFEQAVHFTTPDGQDAVVGAGSYRVELAGQSDLRLVSPGEKQMVLLKAQRTSHQDKLPVPVVLSVPDEGDSLHLVLLLPGGKALETVGSYRQVQTRGLPELLTPTQLHDALLRKARTAR